MTNSKQALIIATEVATNGFESGASLRLDSIRELVEDAGFKVSVFSRKEANEKLTGEWDLVVMISFATAKFLRRARKHTKYLWFDATDSWTLTRLSLIRQGELKHVFTFLRDLFYLQRAPKIDQLTFISRRDAIKEKRWWSMKKNPLILPILGLDREVMPSEEIRFVFVGDGNYGPNKKALKFLSKTLSYLHHNVRIHLYGRNLTTSDSRFIRHGYVEESKFYAKGDIHLAPIRSGAGIKMKASIPLWNGLKVIASPEGANGFSNSPALLVAATPKAFALHMKALQIQKNSPKPIALRSEIYMENQVQDLANWLENLTL
jgi:glycosyltransferase involved in cell wall biosynthesis